ncbi:hypothetical protein L615_001200000070 [Nocardioides sp. J9]|uniref:hypothetical protein n=1 Tax=Nocardioides sp. J9 TaxID=935844 RepID=UPI0011A80987|nr:hypothetical protein [Nocardioides sp. J9]TWH03138.1 hypothetical protein L615_001200000070 [Nocardioides sp. J9]
MTDTIKRKKRPSKAAVARALAEVEARPKQRELPEHLATVIAEYKSGILDPDTLEQVRPFLVAAITASDYTGAELVRKYCNHLAQLACFALDRGVALQVEKLLTTEFIDEYIRVGMAQGSDHNRAERRRRLLALARNANPGPDAPPRLTPVGHSSVKPCYTPTEMALILRASKVQPSQARQRDLAIVVALGAGAGLDSIDIRDLRTDHIEDLGERGILIHVQGPRPRTVVLRARYEALLRKAIENLQPGQLLIGRKQDRRNTAARATERAALHNVPHIEPARLRATWLADLMTDTIPIAVILKAAGLKSARTLSELQPHLGPWVEHKGLTTTSAQFRGAQETRQGGEQQ